MPALEARGLADFGPELRERMGPIIEAAADRSQPPLSPAAASFTSTPDVFDPRMNPLHYEQHCALLLERAGWTTRLTGSPGDQGADVIAFKDGKTLVVQCKLYRSPVGNDAVQQVHAARTFQGADAAAVVSNQPYTKSARALAHVNGVRLLHHEELGTLTI